MYHNIIKLKNMETTKKQKLWQIVINAVISIVSLLTGMSL